MADADDLDQADPLQRPRAKRIPHTRLHARSVRGVGLTFLALTATIVAGVTIHAMSQKPATEASIVPAITPVTNRSTVSPRTWRQFGLSIGRPDGTPHISLADAEYRALENPGENALHILEAALVEYHTSPSPRSAGRLAWAFSMQPGLREAFSTTDRRYERQLLVRVIDARTGRLLTSFSHGRWY